MPRFAANLSWLFTEVPFLDRFAEAAHAGFRGVECLFPYEAPARDIAARIEAHRLEFVLLNAPPGEWAAGDRGTASLPGREHEFQADFVVGLRYAQALRCPRIHVMAGLLPADCDRERRARQRATFVRNLRFACEEARAHGITVLIEALNPRDVPGCLFSTQAEAHAIREEVGAPNLKVQMDLYHAQIAEGDLSEKIRRWLPHIGHFQVASVPGRHEPNTGEVSYDWIFRLLGELRYDGWIGCAYQPAQGTTAGLSWLYRLIDRKRLPAAGAD